MSSPDPHAVAMAHLAAVDPILARIIAQHGPCTLMYEPDLFGSVLRAIVGQQLAVRAAATIWARVVALVPEGALTPESVLAVPEEQLRAAGLSWGKVRYMRDCALRFADGTIDPATLASADDEAVIAALTAIKGVGRWTAEMVLMFSLGRPDVLSTGDYGLRSAMQRHWELPGPATPAEMATIAAHWQPHRSVASWYLWRSLGNAPVAPEQAAISASESY